MNWLLCCLDGAHHGLGDLDRAGAAFGPMVGHHAFDPELGRERLEQRDLALGVAREAVDRHHHRHAVFPHILDVTLEIGEALLQRREVLLLEIVLGHPAMHLERADGRHQHHAGGRQPCLAAFDVEELLGAEIGAEAGLGDHIVGELERGLGGDHRVAAMRDIGERAAMDEGRVVLERLHQVRRERILEQRRHRAGRRQVLGGDGLLVARLADLDLAEPPLEIFEVGCEAEDRHHLRGDGDVEAGLAREAVGGAAERGDDVAKRAVVHVHGAAPSNAADVDIELVAPIDVVVDHRREQVVGGADGVEIAGEMEVDVLHRHDLGIAAAGSAALDPEARPKARLAQAHDGPLADQVQRVAQAHRGGGLALSGRRRGDGGDEDQLAVGPVGQRGDVVERDLGLVVAVRDQVLGRDAELALGHLEDRPHMGGLADLDIGFRRLMLVVLSLARFFGIFTRLN